MIKFIIAAFLLLASGLYLLVMGLTPDLIPFIDEGIASFLFFQSAKYLGSSIKARLGSKRDS